MTARMLPIRYARFHCLSAAARARFFDATIFTRSARDAAPLRVTAQLDTRQRYRAVILRRHRALMPCA